MELKNKKVSLILLLIILIISIALRLPNLLDKERGTDEIITVRNAEGLKNSNFALTNYDKNFPNDTNPPLFYILLALSLFIFNSVLTMKIFVVIISLLSIISIYFLTMKIFNEKYAIITTFIYSLNPMHIIYSQHLRPYIFLFLLFNLAIYFLYKFIIKKDNKALIYLTLIFLISFYTHYYALLFIAGAGFTTLIFYLLKKGIDIKKYIIVNLIFLILAIPGFILLKLQLGYHLNQQTISTITLKIIPYPLYKFSVMVDLSTSIKLFPYLIVLFPLILGLVIYGIIRMYKANKDNSIFLFSMFSVPYTILSIAGLIKAVHSFRYLTLLLPIYIIFLVYGLLNIKNKKLKWLLFLIIILGWIIVILYYYSISTTYQWPKHIAI